MGSRKYYRAFGVFQGYKKVGGGMNKLFGNNIEPDCSCCDHCITDGGSRICIKNTFIQNGKCRKFKYNPLLRKPFKPPVLPKFDPDDFRL